MPRPSADASVFHAIADPTRRVVLELLAERELDVSQMLEVLGRGPGRRGGSGGRRGRGVAAPTQSGLSQHLGVLRGAGLVRSRAEGRRRVYRFEPGPLREVADWVGFFDRFWTDKLRALSAFLDGGGPGSPTAPAARTRRGAGRRAAESTT